MAILRICAADGCTTKTLGRHCIQHESVRVAAVVAVELDRGPLVEAGKT